MTEGAGRLTVVGIGPGDPSGATVEVLDALASATDLVGYGTYLDLVPVVDGGPQRHESDNGDEIMRAAHALDLALEGRDVVLVSSGDPGVFAMAAAVMEVLGTDGERRWESVDVRVLPGVSAAQAAAARVGAPLGHDFCTISLSDNLKSWELIERRLRAAADADFVIALYNPKSKARPDQFGRAVELLLEYRRPQTPVVLGRDIGRGDEVVRIVQLGDLPTPELVDTVDMRTVVIIGSSHTRWSGSRVYTPRRYRELEPGLVEIPPALARQVVGSRETEVS
jgi:cobalt-precorrin 5A hydrolase/precorrin-3B C17-methyltransferase